MKEGSIRKKPVKYKGGKQEKIWRKEVKRPFYDFPSENSENSDSDSMDNLSKDLVQLSTAQKGAVGWRTCPVEGTGEGLDMRRRDSNKFLGELAERLIREEEGGGREEEEEEGGGMKEGGGRRKEKTREEGGKREEEKGKEGRRVGRRRELIEKVGEMWRRGEGELGHRILFEFFDRLTEEDFKEVVLKLAGRGKESEKRREASEQKDGSKKDMLKSKRKEDVKNDSNEDSKHSFESSKIPDPNKVSLSKNNTSESKDLVNQSVTSIKTLSKSLLCPPLTKTEGNSTPSEATEVNQHQSPKKPEAPSSLLPILLVPSSHPSPPPSPLPPALSNPPLPYSNLPPPSFSLPPPPTSSVDTVLLTSPPSSNVPPPSSCLPLTSLPSSSLTPLLSKTNPPPVAAISETPKFSTNLDDNPFTMMNVKPKGLADFFGGLNAPTNQGGGGGGLGEVETGRNQVAASYQREGGGGRGMGGGIGGMGGGNGGGMEVGGGGVGGGGMNRGMGVGGEIGRNGGEKNELFTFRNNANPGGNKPDIFAPKSSTASIFNVSHHPSDQTHLFGMEIEDFSHQRTPDTRNTHPTPTPFFRPNPISVPTNQMEIISNPNPTLAQSTLFQAKNSSFPFTQPNNLLFQGQSQNSVNLFHKNEGNSGLIGLSTPNSMFPSNLNLANSHPNVVNEGRVGSGMMNNGTNNNAPPFFANNTDQNFFNLRKNEQEQKSPFSHVQNFNIFQNDARSDGMNTTPNTPSFMGFQNTNNANFQNNTPFFPSASNLNNTNHNFFEAATTNGNAFNNVDKNFALSLFDKKPDALKSNSTPNSLSLFSNGDRQKSEKPKPIDPTLERMLKKGQNKPLRLNP